MAGFVPKFQPSVTKTVGGVAFQRNKIATILYMYRFYICIDRFHSFGDLKFMQDWCFEVKIESPASSILETN